MRTGWSAVRIPRSVWLKCDTLLTLHMLNNSLFSMCLKKNISK
ncbi:hypothetical protein FB99_41310 (plasmid) [Pantoea agglomerans]|nr:hypothetical protein FB99_41310 [Pantoea agglomerans]